MTFSTAIAAIQAAALQPSVPIDSVSVPMGSAIGQGVSIALAGMAIVAVALTLISLFIAALPHMLNVVARFWPEVEEPHAKKSHPESLVPDNDAVLAAIGYVLHCEFQKQLQHDPQATGKN
tara:strand:- start:897660 stop:898022 length:363 start_codon:yes stop_codon:yes gene_type:complete